MIPILIVENDLFLAQALANALPKQRFAVTCVATLYDAKRYIKKKEFDVVVVDRILNDGDGLNLLHTITFHRPTTKVIILTTRGLQEEKVAGLTQGVDDYLSKPLSLVEFRLRIEKWTTLNKTQPVDYRQVQDVKLFPHSGELIVGEKTRTIRRKEMQILDCLFRHKNRTVSREMLIDFVWQGEQDIPTYTTIDVYLRRIRLLLGDRGSLIKTVRGYGYMAEEAAGS
ncbi:MAG TPA: response regulator transcription factor [Vitreimonas sp.]|nr:response regulator transcription factor [Vitreimonas sp.]